MKTPSDSSLSTAKRTRTPRNKSLGHQLLTLPDQIAEYIFKAIANGDYAPGERIREESLAEQFAVSRGPVREALRILENDSVVRILPNRGAHVTQLSIKEVSDIFEIRSKLFGMMVGRLTTDEAALLADTMDADIRALDELAKDEAEAAAYFEATYRLSSDLRQACNNERLFEILESLARQTLRYTQLGLATLARRKESARNWRAMQKALRAGDLKEAAHAAEKLIEDAQEEAVKQLKAREASQ